ncbi:MAG: class I SAM-dependent methyltransferase [Theionarchaea archaeon]|nr:class I SAM-dependent methyltransferase [Theionarchaea archaeon]
MSIYILMKILESSPQRYDTGIRIITLGRLDQVYDQLISHVKKGRKILDIGCGTGALTVKAAQKGAIVKGIDVNPSMLEISQKKANELNLENVEFQEMGVAELDTEQNETYDIVLSGLCFSELTYDELLYTLKEVNRILKPDGRLLVADEVLPGNVLKRILTQIVRIPLLIITYVIAQTTTKPIKGLEEMVEKSGFVIESAKLNRMENFITLVCRKEGYHE